MEARNCSRCGRVFNYTGKVICQDCIKKEDEEFKIVKEYIEEHRECKMDEVVAETGVSHKRIMKFLREGRLEVSKGMQADLTCESCGEPIIKGKFCDRCGLKISGGIKDMFKARDEAAAKAIGEKVFGKMHMRKKL